MHNIVNESHFDSYQNKFVSKLVKTLEIIETHNADVFERKVIMFRKVTLVNRKILLLPLLRFFVSENCFDIEKCCVDFHCCLLVPHEQATPCYPLSY